MGIYCNACRYAISVVKDNVGGFPCYPRQFNQLLHSFRYLSMEFFNEEFAAGFEVFSFVMVEACGVDVLFKFFYVGVCVVFGVDIF